ncbi:MAG: hypothetical protein GY861_21770 [bacterium]|nr:hypothetical protein [bacterium]
MSNKELLDYYLSLGERVFTATARVRDRLRESLVEIVDGVVSFNGTTYLPYWVKSREDVPKDGFAFAVLIDKPGFFEHRSFKEDSIINSCGTYCYRYHLVTDQSYIKKFRGDFSVRECGDDGVSAYVKRSPRYGVTIGRITIDSPVHFVRYGLETAALCPFPTVTIFTHSFLSYMTSFAIISAFEKEFNSQPRRVDGEERYGEYYFNCLRLVDVDSLNSFVREVYSEFYGKRYADCREEIVSRYSNLYSFLLAL